MVRFRPLNRTEISQGERDAGSVFTTPTRDSVDVHGDRSKTRTYDRAFGVNTPQGEVFEAIGAPVINNVVKGYNGTVLAYGQTGSGKTHTMLGPDGGTTDSLSKGSPLYPDRGLVPRLAEALFDALEVFDKEEIEWKVFVSVFELYKENIGDCLGENQRGDFRIREDATGGRGIYVENLYAKQSLSASELLEAIRVGASRRRVASTNANETSSRSHSITLIRVEQVNKVLDGVTINSQLTLVDLAGSEKVGKTGAAGERLKEAQTINLSLTLLGNVIFRLTDGKSAYIPYRDSKLTRLLQDSLGGNSCTTLLCCCSPAEYNKAESITTLQFASRAKQIKNKPRVNRDLGNAELQSALNHALNEITVLQEKLDIHQRIADHRSPEKRPRGTSLYVGDDAFQVDDDDECAALQRQIVRLLDDVSELKKAEAARDDDDAKAKLQVEFHKQRAAAAEEERDEVAAKLKREEALFKRKIAELTMAVAESEKLKPITPNPKAPAGADDRTLVSVTGRRVSSAAEASADPRPRRSSGSGAAVLRRRPSAGRGSMVRQPLQGERPTPTGGPASRGGSAGRRSPLAMLDDAVPVELLAPASTLDVLDVENDPTVPVEARRTLLGGASPPPHVCNCAAENTDLKLKIEALESELQKMKYVNDRLHKTAASNKELMLKVCGELEKCQSELDDARQGLDATKKVLEGRDKECAGMKQILDALNINVEEQLAMLSDEKLRNAALSGQANRLRDKTNELEEAAAQQEYCEMASMELLVKTEDMEAVDNELNALRYGRQMQPDYRSAVTRSCTDTIHQLEVFLDVVVAKLESGVFATSNLESQRLTLLGDAATLNARALIAKQALLDVSQDSSAAQAPNSYQQSESYHF
jgi:hypothetical protein